MRVLVTGGAGFIGSHLCAKLIEKGHQVTAVDNLSNGSISNLDDVNRMPGFVFYQMDVNDKEKLKSVFENHSFDIVFHLAANADVGKGEENSQLDFDNTLRTTLSVLEMMRIYGISKFYFASSSTVYGNSEERIQEQSTLMRPISHYGAAKLASEAFISSYSNLYGMRVWIARFCNAVGPKMTHGVIPDLIKKVKKRPDALDVYGDGNQTKPYIYIDDLLDGVFYMLEKSQAQYNTFLVGVDTSLTVSRIAQIVMEETGIKVPIKYKGEYGGWRGDVKHYMYDVTSLRMLGWTPLYSAEEAVRRAVRDNLDIF